MTGLRYTGKRAHRIVMLALKLTTAAVLQKSTKQGITKTAAAQFLPAWLYKTDYSWFIIPGCINM